MAHYKFDLAFQECIIASFISDKETLVKQREIVKPEFFDDEVLCGVTEAILSFFDKEKSLPDEHSLCEEVKNFQAPGRKYGEYAEAIQNIYRKIGTNTDYYKQQAIEFAKKQAIMNAIRESQELAESGDYDKIQSIMTGAMQTGGFQSNLITDFFDNVKQRAINYQKRKNIDPSRVTTGLPELDSITDGGLARGELGMIVAPPKHGKSTALFNFGASAVMAGKNVLHISLEMKKNMVEARYDCRFFGSSLLDIKKRPKTFYKAMKKVRETLKGRLKIVEYPTLSLTVHSLRSIASEVGDLGMIILDYADLMRPIKQRDDKRLELVELYQNVRRVAGELQVPIWTASQSRRDSVGSRVIEMHQVSECFDKIATVDLAVSLCQTEAESSSGRMRLFVMASRLGPSKEQIECTVDWKTAKIVSSSFGGELE